MKTQAYNNPTIGCYFDGTQGQPCNDRRVIELALDYGWKDKDASDIIECGDLSDEQQEIIDDVVQDAEEYLNGLETRPFLSWQWNDGDFGLYPNMESAAEDCEFVSSSGRCRNGKEYPDDDYAGEWLHVNDHGNVTLYVRENGEDKEIWSCV